MEQTKSRSTTMLEIVTRVLIGRMTLPKYIWCRTNQVEVQFPISLAKLKALACLVLTTNGVELLKVLLKHNYKAIMILAAQAISIIEISQWTLQILIKLSKSCKTGNVR